MWTDEKETTNCKKNNKKRKIGEICHKMRQILKKKDKYAEQTKESRNQRKKDTKGINKEKLNTKYERKQKCRYVVRAERG